MKKKANARPSPAKRKARSGASRAKKPRMKPGDDSAGIKLIGGRKIPFKRIEHPETTSSYFGNWTNNGNYLLKIESRKSGTSWHVCVDAWNVERSRLATRQLRGENLDDPAVKHLFYAVQAIQMRPDEIHNPMALSDGGLVRDLVKEAITTGNRHQLDRLSRFIEAVHNSGNEKSWRVAKAIGAAARKKNDVPTATEALQEFANAGGDTDAKNFNLALKDAGFRWLIGKRS